LPHPVDIHVGSRLRALRTRRGQSQANLADKLGLTFQQVQKYESGANRISASKLFAISRIMGVTPDYFFEGLEYTGDGETAEVDLKAIRIATMIAKISDKKIKKYLYGMIKALVASDAEEENHN
jgi:transcriptional regulator with XRE-family HTH domain